MNFFFMEFDYIIYIFTTSTRTLKQLIQLINGLTRFRCRIFLFVVVGTSWSWWRFINDSSFDCEFDGRFVGHFAFFLLLLLCCISIFIYFFLPITIWSMYVFEIKKKIKTKTKTLIFNEKEKRDSNQNDQVCENFIYILE